MKYPTRSNADARALEPQLWDALNRVIDPCSEVAQVPAGLVDMGMIDSVHVLPSHGEVQTGYCVEVRFGLTEPGCMMAISLMPQIRQALLALPLVNQVKVNLLTDFVWSTERMSASLQERLAQQKQSSPSLQASPLAQPLRFHAPNLKGHAA
jgi:metal-sulfur cluster biosynthetic enzyme